MLLSGYIPVSDANGEMTWTNPDSIVTGSASSSWYEANSTSTPDNINDDVYTNGKVGINTDNPSYDLEINGNLGFTSWDNTSDSVGIYFFSNSDNAQIRYVSRDDNTGNTFLEISTGDNGDEPIIFSQRAIHQGSNGNVINVQMMKGCESIPTDMLGLELRLQPKNLMLMVRLESEMGQIMVT